MKSMKWMAMLAAVVLSASLAWSGSARAQSGNMQGMDMKGVDAKSGSAKAASAGNAASDKGNAQAMAYRVGGVVRKADPAKGTVTIAHGPVPELNWPAMTMAFAVRDPKLFDKLALDRKVEFTFVQQGAAHVVTAVKEGCQRPMDGPRGISLPRS